MTHKKLIEKLINDENIIDNIDVCDSYEQDNYGNTLITMSFEGVDLGKTKGYDGIISFMFNNEGRLVRVEMATSKKGKNSWQIALSEKFVNFNRILTAKDQ